jgi:hypothetical protein
VTYAPRLESNARARVLAGELQRRTLAGDTLAGSRADKFRFGLDYVAPTASSGVERSVQAATGRLPKPPSTSET